VKATSAAEKVKVLEGSKDLHEIATEAGVTAKQFPFEFEVRLLSIWRITEAVLHNRPSMLAHFTKIASTSVFQCTTG
jgi:hypothetical protein